MPGRWVNRCWNYVLECSAHHIPPPSRPCGRLGISGNKWAKWKRHLSCCRERSTCKLKDQFAPKAQVAPKADFIKQWGYSRSAFWATGRLLRSTPKNGCFSNALASGYALANGCRAIRAGVFRPIARNPGRLTAIARHGILPGVRLNFLTFGRGAPRHVDVDEQAAIHTPRRRRTGASR